MAMLIISSSSYYSIASETSDEEPPSFYGNRSVTQHKPEQKTPEIRFQRRAVAPPITIENDIPTSAESQESKSTTENTFETKGLSLAKPVTIPLTRQELILANKARYYIERNWNSDTGLIDSVQGYPHSTMWDIASSLAALLALDALKLMPSNEASFKIEKTLSTLANFPLYNGKLPNREYNTQTALPSGRFSKSKSNGNGWSALDIGRLLIWLHVTSKMKPQFSEQINQIITKWDLSAAIHNKTLYGELKTRTGRVYRQEGRLGYLQYAATGFKLYGYNVSEAFSKNNIKQINVSNVPLLIDTRNLPFFTTDPHALSAIELHMRDSWWNQLDELYQLHHEYYKRTGKSWVFAEDAMSHSPWFSYNNIYFYGTPWLSTSAGGKPIENPQVFSNKIAISLSVLFDDEFSSMIKKQVINNSLGLRSVPTGTYDNNAPNQAFNINTNSLVLVSLWFKTRNYRSIIDVVNEHDSNS